MVNAPKPAVTKKNIPTILLTTLLLILALPSISTSINLNQLSPYVQKYPMGSIDWDKGLIFGIGRAYLDDNSFSKPRTQGAAQVMASGNIVKLAAGLRLDDKKTLKSLGKEKSTFKIEAFVRDAEFSKTLVDNNNRPYYEIVRVAKIKGVEGITAQILSATAKEPVKWIPPPRSAKTKLDDDDEPWLVIDARRLHPTLKAEPALFPKIISANGEEIYGLRLVNKNALVQRGMTSYVTSLQWDSKLESIETIETILARVSAALTVREASAAEKRQRKKRQRFVVKDVKGVKGLRRTNLVVSASDAQDLKREDSSTKILQNCRVIVVLSSPTGGIEGAILKIISNWS